MLDDSEVNRFSDDNEAVIKKRFEKLGYTVKKLDGPTKDSRPDFLISNSSGPQMLCEVKTIVSFGYMPDKGAHVSTRDKNLKEFRKEIDLRKMDDDIADAVHKRSALIIDEPKYSKLPLLVAFVFDPLAEDLFQFYPARFNEDVSGILKIKRDVALGKAFGELPDEEQERRLRTGDAAGLPPNTKDFVLAPNKNAIRKVPKDFRCRCGRDEETAWATKERARQNVGRDAGRGFTTRSFTGAEHGGSSALGRYSASGDAKCLRRGEVGGQTISRQAGQQCSRNMKREQPLQKERRHLIDCGINFAQRTKENRQSAKNG